MQDQEFIAGHGYRCSLIDVRLFVERQPESWMAIGYDRNIKLIVMKQPVNDSAEGRQHCQIWVNSFRGSNSPLGLLTETLQWETY
jgi:hypothetical protein